MGMARTTAPYGSWRSIITADRMLAGAVSLGSVARVGEDLLWTEGRPAEGGRTALVRQTPDGTREDLLPAPWNVRSRVHEYGGGALTVAHDRVFFSNDGDRRLYEAPLDGSPPRALTPENAWRYADAEYDARRDRLIAVGEEHDPNRNEPRNALVTVPASGGDVRVLVSGHDFYSNPRVSPDGTKLCWLGWNHPNMPWQETELWIASIDDAGTLHDSRRVAGGNGESIFQPAWSPDGVLHFVSDRTGWWSLFRRENESDRLLVERGGEFGRPQWVFGMTTYAFASAERIVASWSYLASWRLIEIDVASGEARTFDDLPFCEISGLHPADGRVYFVGTTPSKPAALIDLDLETGSHRVLRRSLDLDLDLGWVSVGAPIEFTSGDHTAHAFYYPPTNPDFEAPEGELPPLRVRSHGGPTAASDPSFKLPIQYWTTRGFAVVDVNYTGSTGYGRSYRDGLAGRWGEVDVEDCVNAARALADRDLVDRNRLTISGGSAGGYTVLCALTFHDVFRAGASHYGIGDLSALAEDTHKFESRYTDWLVAPYPAGKDVYDARSPLFHVDQLSCPVIFFQGGEDRVVPPGQAQAMVDALREKGVPVEHVVFPEEGHGFRDAKNIKRALEDELAFFGKILGFTPA